MRTYNLRAYKKEDIDNLTSEIVTSQTGDSYITPPVVTQKFDFWGNLINKKQNDAITNDVLTQEQWTYDSAGNILTYRNPEAYNLGIDTYVREYDYANRLVKETVNDETNGASVTQTSYDKLGRITSVTDPRGNTVTNTYDYYGNLTSTQYPITDTITYQTNYSYDSAGNVVCVTVQNGSNTNTAFYTYDNRNRVVSEAQSSNNTYDATKYEYDGTGNIVRIYTGIQTSSPLGNLDTTGANMVEYEYDFMGYPVKFTDALGNSETYTVDYLGNMLSKTDRNNHESTYTYNRYGQLLYKHAADNTYAQYSYDVLGNRVQMTDSTGITNYTYSSLSQLLSESKGSVLKEYTYDANSNRTGFDLSYGNTQYIDMTYSVTSTGLLTGIQSDSNTVTYTYDSAGNVLTETINSLIGMVNTYNKANRLASVTNTVNGVQISSFTNSFAQNGNVSSVIANVGGITKTTNYIYDKANRLQSEGTLGDNINRLLEYEYDSSGNRSSKCNSDVLTSSSSNTTYTYDANNRITEAHVQGDQFYDSYTYDNNGNMSSKMYHDGLYVAGSVNTYFDDFNRLKSALLDNGAAVSPEPQYTYDGDNHMMSRQIYTNDGIDDPVTQLVWDGDNIVMEITDGDVVVYERGINIISSYDGTNKTYYCYNSHGDVVQLLDSTGAVTRTYEYDAFGVGKNFVGNDTNPFRYCGEYYDLSSGLIYLRNRYYDPSIGRFISEDPIRSNKGGWNWYTYCANNPIRYKDPSGLVITCDEANSGRIISLLREVSGNSLEFEYKDGQINITKTYDTKHHVGQTLVSDLINSSETVNVNIGVDSSGNTNTEWSASGSNPMQIFIDPDNTTGNGLFTTYTQDTDGNILEEVIPAYIVFGHELIHAWRDIRGLDVPSRAMVGLIPQDSPQLWREEELQTMGINYTDAVGNPLRNYSSYVGIISENGLRLENELNVRISYYGW